MLFKEKVKPCAHKFKLNSVKLYLRDKTAKIFSAFKRNLFAKDCAVKKSPSAHLVIREVKAVLIFLISSFRQLELHSPDTRHTVVLRCPDQPSALSWFAAMHSVTSSLAQVWLLLH